MPTPANDLNISQIGLVKFDGTATFTGVTVTNHAVLVGSTSNNITSVGPSATTGQVLQSQGSTTDPAFSTATYPATTTINDILYSSSNNVVGQITAANSSALVSSSAGIPSWTAGIDNSVLVGVTGGTPDFSTSSTTYFGGISFNSGTDVMSTYLASGSYTPTLRGSSTAGTTTYTLQAGSYTKIGDRVFVDVLINYTNMTGTGDMEISLPFTAKTITNMQWQGSVAFTNVNTPTYVTSLLGGATTSPVVSQVLSAGTTMRFVAYRSANPAVTIAAGAPSSGTGVIAASINYIDGS